VRGAGVIVRSVRPELVEGLSFFGRCKKEKGQWAAFGQLRFDKLSPNGMGVVGRTPLPKRRR
jgi:hypothetical protein